MTPTHDLLVIGAGPAGLAAAVQGRSLGLTVALLDEQAEPGGQIYRAVERAETDGRAAIIGRDYRYGLELVHAFRQSGTNYFASHQVWQVEADGRVFASSNGQSIGLVGRRVLIAIGAMERPVPIPGWTLPGVMTVGAAQILHKSIGLLPDEGVWIAGSGPLALRYAAELAAAGARVAGMLDTSQRSNLRAALPHWRGALHGWRYVSQGIGYLGRLRQSGIRRVAHVESVEAVGKEQIEMVRWRVGGEWHEAPASGLLLHEGVIPNAQLTMAIGCTHTWDIVQHCFRPSVDVYGQTDKDAILVAGDCGGIGGARLAEFDGRLAAIGSASALGFISQHERDRRALAVQRERASHAAIRPFLDALYSPRDELRIPRDEQIICRCESVTAGRIREAVSVGCVGPNQVKAFTRCGMGPCQGRMCGVTVTEIIAEKTGIAPDKVGSFRVRPPLKPLCLGELASLEEHENPGAG